MKARTVPIGCHRKHAPAVELLKLLIRYNDPLDYKGEDGNNNPAGACCILRPVRPIWPVHGSYTGRCGRCVVYTDRSRMNESIHRASPVHSQQEYIATGLALYKNILLPAIHRASPVYSQMGYIGTHGWRQRHG